VRGRAALVEFDRSRKLADRIRRLRRKRLQVSFCRRDSGAELVCLARSGGVGMSALAPLLGYKRTSAGLITQGIVLCNALPEFAPH
jgi:hypothetical protein